MRKKIVAICTGVAIVVGAVAFVMFNNKKTNADEKAANIETMTEQETTTQIETTTVKELITKEKTAEVETTSEDNKETETQAQETKAQAEQEAKQQIEVLDKTMYATSTANVRSGADIGASLAGQLYGGMSVHVTGVTGEWYEIEFNSSKAYVHNSLLSDTAPVYTEPEPQVQLYQEPVYQETETQAPYQEPETQAPQPVYTEPEIQATNNDLDDYQPQEYKDGDIVNGVRVDLSPGPSLEELQDIMSKLDLVDNTQ